MLLILLLLKLSNTANIGGMTISDVSAASSTVTLIRCQEIAAVVDASVITAVVVGTDLSLIHI